MQDDLSDLDQAEWSIVRKSVMVERARRGEQRDEEMFKGGL